MKDGVEGRMEAVGIYIPVGRWSTAFEMADEMALSFLNFFHSWLRGKGVS